MIRIDFKINETYVNTTWVSEQDDKHSLMGRLTFTIEEWQNLKISLDNAIVYLNEK